MRKQVLRLENKNGHGPFEFTKYIDDRPTKNGIAKRFADSLGWVHYEIEVVDDFAALFVYVGANPGDEVVVMHPDATHPHHMEDVPLPDSWDEHTWKIGVKDQAQFDHWFPPQSMPILAELGFELLIYECDEKYIHMGTYQLLFCADDAVLIEKRPLV